MTTRLCEANASFSSTRSRSSTRRCRRARAASAPPAPGRCPSRAGRRPATALATNAPSGSAPSSRALLLARDHERGGAVVEPARVAGRDRAVRRGTPASARRASRRVVSGRGCSSRSTLADRRRARRRSVRLGGRRPALLRLERERVLLLPRHVPALGDVLAGLAHRLEREHLLHPRVREAPAERRVVDGLVAAREGACRAWPSRAARGSSTRRRRRRRGRRHPRATAWHAETTAESPDAQSRFTVTPATDSGSPASSAAMRATLRLSSPAWFAQPK